MNTADAKRHLRQRLSSDFYLTDERRQLALNHWGKKGRLDLDPVDMFEQFINHHTAKGSVMACWDAAWRTWYGNAVKFTHPPVMKKHNAFERLTDRAWANGMMEEPR